MYCIVSRQRIVATHKRKNSYGGADVVSDFGLRLASRERGGKVIGSSE